MEGGHHNSKSLTYSGKLFAYPVPGSDDFCFLPRSVFFHELQEGEQHFS